ncbi:DUF1439 domain-containing protein [Marinomonas mediterranea]|jgi:Protein of unknown function (DUF1439).|uniref:Lipoprotein n=1 Tax=Marinomonas mediterranea (strain ATCC 700492 / JCM 21426 / NBRC 103028 / MMB-1) TaxID=717774 RepID=F2K4X7_MARM1|nr:DUF1439 domain-containing protein [Marinomonas mediterranea]ADZ92620.1 hypothetical protein Marme_3404 [Marinomonas mediterranea MMB-1]WCN18658.1 DUF1439 domain-containing protein [Marinomonas mediterranea MMB-1]
MRKTSLLLIVLFPLFLSGCNGVSLSEEALNREVATRLAEKQPDRIRLTLEDKALDLVLLVKRADIDLSSEFGGIVKIVLDTDIQGSIEAFGKTFTMTTSLVPKLESGVRLDDDLVYLVAPKLTEVSVQGTNFSDQMLRSTLGSVHDELEQAIVQYFDVHPIYRLDHNATEKLAATLIDEIHITDDALEFGVF